MLKSFILNLTVLTMVSSSLSTFSRKVAYALSASAKTNPPRNTSGEIRLKTRSLSGSEKIEFSKGSDKIPIPSPDFKSDASLDSYQTAGSNTFLPT